MPIRLLGRRARAKHIITRGICLAYFARVSFVPTLDVSRSFGVFLHRSVTFLAHPVVVARSSAHPVPFLYPTLSQDHVLYRVCRGCIYLFATS
jgi:hypothetical protein